MNYANISKNDLLRFVYYLGLRRSAHKLLALCQITQ